MVLRVSGKNMDIGEALRSRVQERVAGALHKYFDGGYSGHVTVARDGTGFRTDCVLHLPSGITLEASGSAHDAHASFDQTAERIEKRLRRYKRRLKDSPGSEAGRTGGPSRLAEAAPEPAAAEAEPDGEAVHPAVIAETMQAPRRFSVSDAVLQLDMTGAPALVFVHAGTGRLNVVYRRHDGAIGWIDPPPEEP